MRKGLRVFVAGATTIAVLAGGMYLNSNGHIYEKRDVIYQGYTSNKADSYNLLVFDNKTRANRTDAPDLSAIGNPTRLEIGKRFDVKVKSPRWFGMDKIKSIKPSD